MFALSNTGIFLVPCLRKKFKRREPIKNSTQLTSTLINRTSDNLSIWLQEDKDRSGKRHADHNQKLYLSCTDPTFLTLLWLFLIYLLYYRSLIAEIKSRYCISLKEYTCNPLTIFKYKLFRFTILATSPII